VANSTYRKRATNLTEKSELFCFCPGRALLGGGGTGCKRRAAFNLFLSGAQAATVATVAPATRRRAGDQDEKTPPTALACKPGRNLRQK
jgi:hypothetical protein